MRYYRSIIEKTTIIALKLGYSNLNLKPFRTLYSCRYYDICIYIINSKSDQQV